MRWRVRVAVLVSIALGGALAVQLVRSEVGKKSHHFALYRPGETSAFKVVKHQLAFSPLAPPFAAGERFYLIGAKRGGCSAEGKARDPLMVLALDPSTLAVTELPAVGAPEARIEPRIVAVEDGFFVIGGRQRDQFDDCLLQHDTLLRLAVWAQGALPLGGLSSVDRFLDQLIERRVRRGRSVDEGRIVHETYRYRFSQQAWERMPSLDLLADGDPNETYLESADFRSGVGANLIAPGVVGSGVEFLLDLESEHRVPIPTLQSLGERGILIENSWSEPSILDGKLILFFPQGTRSARSAAAIDEQNGEERRALEALPDDESWQRGFAQLAERVTPHAGLMFDFKVGAWSPINSAGAPWQQQFDEFHGTTAVSRGKLVVFTGESKRPGGIYDPQSDRWTPVAREGAPQLDAMEAVSVKGAAIGELIAVFYSSAPTYDGNTHDRTVHLFDVARNSWRALPAAAGDVLTAATESSDHLLLWSSENERLEWLDLASGLRNPLVVAPQFTGFQFAASANGALFYNLHDSGE